MNREVIVILPKETMKITCPLDDHVVTFGILPGLRCRGTEDYLIHMNIEPFIHNGLLHYIAKHSESVSEEEVVKAIRSNS